MDNEYPTFGAYSRHLVDPQPTEEPENVVEAEVALTTEPLEKPKPKPKAKKAAKNPPLIAKRNCRINLNGVQVALKMGCEVHGLTRQEREHLKKHNLAE